MDKKKDIVIVGAGGMGREVQWYLERIIEKTGEWNFLGYIDNGLEQGKMINGYPVLGGSAFLLERQEELAVVCAIGTPETRKELIEDFKKNPKLYFPNIIDEAACISDRVTLGEGNIICPGVIITVDVKMGDFNILNLNCTLAHDDVLGSFTTINGNTNVAGNVTIGDLCDIGTGCQIIQKKNIGNKTIMGAGAVVIQDVPGDCTVVGCPARVIKSGHA